MPDASTAAEVILWDRVVGALVWDPAKKVGTFEYTADFLSSGIELSPLERFK
jgi:serine/threonine-protein kinase HipA